MTKGGQIANILFGAWLVASALLWPDNPAQFWNACVCGLLAVGFAVASLTGHEWGQILGGAVGMWLVLSPAALPSDRLLTAVNHGLFGAAIIVCALWPGRRQPAHILSGIGVAPEE